MAFVEAEVNRRIDELAKSSQELVSLYEEIKDLAERIGDELDTLESAFGEMVDSVESEWSGLDEQASGLLGAIGEEQTALAEALGQASDALEAGRQRVTALGSESSQSTASLRDAFTSAAGSLESGADSTRQLVESIESSHQALVEQADQVETALVGAFEATRDLLSGQVREGLVQIGSDVGEAESAAVEALEGQTEQIASVARSDFEAKAGEVEALLEDAFANAVEHGAESLAAADEEYTGGQNRALDQGSDQASVLAEAVGRLQSHLATAQDSVASELTGLSQGSESAEGRLGEAGQAIERANQGFTTFLRDYPRGG